MEFDSQPPPVLDLQVTPRLVPVCYLDLQEGTPTVSPEPERWAQAFTLWLRASNFDRHSQEAAACIRQVLDANPFTTLQVVLEPSRFPGGKSIWKVLPPQVLETLTAACQAAPTYLDRYYALQPGRPNGAKRLVIVLPAQLRSRLDTAWVEEV